MPQRHAAGCGLPRETRDKKEEATICESLCGYSLKQDKAVVQIGVASLFAAVQQAVAILPRGGEGLSSSGLWWHEFSSTT